ncbi:MAG: NAD-dependent epimerase/dehydratase family protein [Clostridiales bacterium]|nr:NAD-dependent epimerase/dehydratase family protein [Clostridiales bacterium]
MESMLITGGTGFLGKCIIPLLNKNYEITTCGITPEDELKADLAKEIPEIKRMYDVVLHACGKAHVVPRNEAEAQAFYDVNYQGTVNLCKALERCGTPKAIVFISTVAVYGCESGELIDEKHPRNGDTPYAKSKIMAEDYLADWCEKNECKLAIVRPSLIAGPNPPGNLGAMISGIKTGKYLSIAGGKARKSVLMAQDIARLLPLLVKKGGVYNVCDDQNPSFRELEISISRQLGKKTPLSIPMWMAKPIALVGDLMGTRAPINSSKLTKITESLTFSNEKAKKELGWVPLSVIENFKIN